MDRVNKYKQIPAMTPSVVHNYLRQIGMDYKGKGCVVELGSWLGATAAPLLEGLNVAGYRKPFYAYDRWEVNREQVEQAQLFGYDLNKVEDSSSIFLENVSKEYDNVKMFKGEITTTIKNYDGGKIEICLFDAPKKNPVFDFSIKTLLPHFIPGVTIFGLLDFYFYKQKTGRLRQELKAPVKFIETYKKHFTRLAEWPQECSCVFFRYEKEIKL